MHFGYLLSHLFLLPKWIPLYGVLCLFCISCRSFISKCRWFIDHEKSWWYMWILNCFFDCCIVICTYFLCLFNYYYGNDTLFLAKIRSFRLKFGLVSYVDLRWNLLKSISYANSLDSWDAQYSRNGFIFSQ